MKSIMDLSREASSAQGQAIEALIRAYLVETGLSVDDVELVEQRRIETHDERGATYTTTYFVRRRQAATTAEDA